jgi:hypothetical protein
MAKDRFEQFAEMRPIITDEDILKAAQADQVVMSWDGYPVVDEDSSVTSFALKLALGNGSVTTLLFDRVAGELLGRLLADLKDSDWRATQSTPPGQMPH